ncbi:protein tyrosine kinase, partial [Teladorsagia circumcincta]
MQTGESARNAVSNALTKLKTEESEISKEKIKEMMQEARLMRELNHPNVVRIYGVALLEHPLYIILEYVPGGALDVYLRKNKQISQDDRLLMAMGAAWGMEYLHMCNILHRDIAARNCLYDNDKIVKISDFGLSREGTTYRMKTAKRVPLKWMAPETMSNYTFTQKTDVYSYGIMGGQVNEFPKDTPPKLAIFVKQKLWDPNPETRFDMTS